jgi:GC-rich sequence DNA-binding factor
MIQQRRRDDDDNDLSILCGPLPESDRTQEKSNETEDSAPAPLSKREIRVARVARRQLRQQRRKIDEEEGYSTDSSLAPSDAIAYNDALKSLISKKKDVLSDVKVKEFHKPDNVRWSVWRDKYTDSYMGAWGGLGVISVWEFWARLEIVGWDCMEVNPPITFLIKTALIHV